MLNALASKHRERVPTLSIHRLGRGLQGYLILFAPHAFVPQRQYRSSWLPSLLVFQYVSTDCTPTRTILPTSPGF